MSSLAVSICRNLGGALISAARRHVILLKRVNSDIRVIPFSLTRLTDRATMNLYPEESAGLVRAGTAARRNDGNDLVAITGIGLITPVGLDRESSWRAIRAGQSGMRHIWLSNGDRVTAAPVPLDGPPGDERVIRFAERAADEAVADARLDWARLDRDRVGCVMGAIGFVPADVVSHVRQGDASGAACWLECQRNNVASSLASRYDLYGPAISLAAACATGLISVLRGADCILDGCCDVVLAGSSDASLDVLAVGGFRNMRVLAESENPTEACRPFDAKRSGFVIGEGAAVFVLERMSVALERGASIYAVLAGGVSGSDAYHITALDPDPSGLAWMIRKALQRAGVTPEEVDYINAHGTGTRQNDIAEVQAIKKAFGPAAATVRVSAMKSMIGHLLCAAGGVELALATLAVRDGFIPPTINLTEQDPECDIDCTALRGVATPVRTALKLSIAFGGHIGIAVLRHPHCYGMAARRAA